MNSGAKRSLIDLCHILTSSNFSAESWGLTWNAPFRYPIILVDQRHCHSLHIPYIPQWLKPSLAHFYSLGRLKLDCKFTRHRHHSACVALRVHGQMLWLQHRREVLRTARFHEADQLGAQITQYLTCNVLAAHEIFISWEIILVSDLLPSAGLF